MWDVSTSFTERFLLQDSLVKPITRILIGVALITLMITIVSRETPEWMKKLNFSPGNFPPWILACVVIVFTRMRKRTKDFLNKRGWWMNFCWCFCCRVLCISHYTFKFSLNWRFFGDQLYHHKWYGFKIIDVTFFFDKNWCHIWWSCLINALFREYRFL